MPWQERAVEVGTPALALTVVVAVAAAFLGTDTALILVGTVLEVAGLVVAVYDLEARASRGRRRLPGRMAYDWLMRKLRRGAGRTLDIGHASAHLGMSGKARIQVVRAEPGSEVEDRLSYLRLRVEDLERGLEDVRSEALAEVNALSTKLTARLDKLTAEIGAMREQLHAMATEGMDLAWFGLAVTAMGVLMVGVGSAL